MIETHVRSKVQPLFNLLAQACVACRLSANVITIISFVSGVVCGVCIAYGYLLLAGCFLWFSGLCDVLDGTVARLTKSSKKVGAYIDLISDRMVESAVMLGFSIYAPSHHVIYLLFMIALLLHFSTFVVAGSLFDNDGPKSMYYDRSIVERAEAFIFFSLMMVCPRYLAVFLMILNILIFWSAGARFCRVLQFARKIDRKIT